MRAHSSCIGPALLGLIIVLSIVGGIFVDGRLPRSPVPPILEGQTRINHTGMTTNRYTGVVVAVRHTQREGGSPFAAGPMTWVYFEDGTTVALAGTQSVPRGGVALTVRGRKLIRIEQVDASS